MKWKYLLPIAVLPLLFSGCSEAEVLQAPDAVSVYQRESADTNSEYDIPYASDYIADIAVEFPASLMSLDNVVQMFSGMGFSDFDFVSEDTLSIYRSESEIGRLEAYIDSNGIVNSLCLSCKGTDIAATGFPDFMSIITGQVLTQTELSELTEKLNLISIEPDNTDFVLEQTIEINGIYFILSSEPQNDLYYLIH